MSFVLDASLALAWFFEDEASPHAVAALDLVAKEGAEVPELWHYEVANGLVSATRRTPARITEDQVTQVLSTLATLPIFGHGFRDAEGARAMCELAIRHGITAYDAAYVALARDLSLPIGTLDGVGRRAGLKQATLAAGVPLLSLGASG